MPLILIGSPDELKQGLDKLGKDEVSLICSATADNWEAMAALAQFIRRFPDHEGLPEAQQSLDQLGERVSAKHYRIAEFYDRIAQRPEAALISYRYYVQRFPYTELAAAAEKRIEELEAEATP